MFKSLKSSFQHSGSHYITGHARAQSHSTPLKPTESFPHPLMSNPILNSSSEGEAGAPGAGYKLMIISPCCWMVTRSHRGSKPLDLEGLSFSFFMPFTFSNDLALPFSNDHHWHSVCRYIGRCGNYSMEKPKHFLLVESVKLVPVIRIICLIEMEIKSLGRSHWCWCPRNIFFPFLSTFHPPLNFKELHKFSVNDKLSQIFAPFEDKECWILLIPPKLFLFCLTSL